MKLNISNHDCDEVWDGTFYKRIANYPNISQYEMKSIIDFIAYEKENGRTVEIECQDSKLYSFILEEIHKKDYYKDVTPPKIIPMPKADEKRGGYITECVSHTTSIEACKKIFKSGKLLSARLSSGLSYEELIKNSRNQAKDPKDYFDYVMLAWGNHRGDSLIMERALKRFPTDYELRYKFKPGIRFYFKYDDIIHHPKATFDGCLPIKIKDELVLKDWVYKIIIPKEYYPTLLGYIPQDLFSKILYVSYKNLNLWEWNDKVYSLFEEEEDFYGQD